MRRRVPNRVEGGFLAAWEVGSGVWGGVTKGGVFGGVVVVLFRTKSVHPFASTLVARHRSGSRRAEGDIILGCKHCGGKGVVDGGRRRGGGGEGARAQKNSRAAERRVI